MFTGLLTFSLMECIFVHLTKYRLKRNVVYIVGYVVAPFTSGQLIISRQFIIQRFPCLVLVMMVDLTSDYPNPQRSTAIRKRSSAPVPRQ